MQARGEQNKNNVAQEKNQVKQAFRNELDKDTADEDNSGMLHNLTGLQMRSAVELKLTNNDRLGSNYEDVSLANPQQQTSTSANQTIGKQSKTASILQAQSIPKQEQENWIDNH
ncbi:hypothetical protein JTB14_036248 [Gonioctena quinquepunctata]|nr:hypothetical protein JTB14_036248 [Gonioctena quinquepunctata]